MATAADLKRLPPHIRRRNRRLGLTITLLAILCALWSTQAVRRGWIYPTPVTYTFPHWMKK